jgi:hypothetical protein
MLKSQLQEFWMSRGYGAEEAGMIINNGFGTNTINWSNITLDQVKSIIGNKESAFPIKNQQSVNEQQHPTQNNAPVNEQQHPTQNNTPVNEQHVFGQNQGSFGQPPAQSHNNNSTVVYCNGDHNPKKELKKAEIDFCQQNAQRFAGKSFCMDCQIAFAKGNLGTDSKQF